MERSRFDEWLPCFGEAASLEVNSSFKLRLVDGKSRLIDKGTAYTDSCGLGWRFSFSAKSKDSDCHDIEADYFGQVGCQTVFSIYFMPHKITASSIEKLEIAVNVTDLFSEIPTPSNFSVIVPRSSNGVDLGSYVAEHGFTGEATVTLCVKVPLSFNCSSLQLALSSSLDGIELADTRFLLPTRLVKSVDVTYAIEPKVVYVNASILLGHSSYLDEALSGHGNNETFRKLNSHSEMQDFTNEYDYESDSDFEPEVQENDPEKKIIPRDDDAVFWFRQTAYKTWKTLVFYYYTGELKFKPLSSKAVSNLVVPEPLADSTDHSCSPKTMYRLASMLHIPQVQALSLGAILRDLSEDNIVDELFSHFTALYPEVRAMEVEKLMAVLTSDVFQKVIAKMKPVFFGEKRPHYYDVVTAVMNEYQIERQKIGHQDVQPQIIAEPNDFEEGEREGEALAPTDQTFKGDIPYPESQTPEPPSTYLPPFWSSPSVPATTPGRSKTKLTGWRRGARR